MSTSAMLLHIHEHEVAAGSFWQALPHIFGDVIASALEITCLVIAMMAVIELVNVSSSGKLMSKLQGRPFLQTLIACLLGVIPGCAGGFAVVSMFTHDLLSFGALAGGMIATFGDEAFFLFAKDPVTATKVSVILFVLGVAVATILNFVGKRWHWKIENHRFDIHEENDVHEHHHGETHRHGFKNWCAHFFKEHLWEHVIKKHLLTIFLWSFFVLLFIKSMGYFLDIEAVLETHSWAKYLLLLIAVCVGFIPESGPNLVFIVMFLEGTLPFGILLANCISQNGHAGLPLLAQSRKTFFVLKTLTLLLGLIVGFALI